MLAVTEGGGGGNEGEGGGAQASASLHLHFIVPEESCTALLYDCFKGLPSTSLFGAPLFPPDSLLAQGLCPPSSSSSSCSSRSSSSCASSISIHLASDFYAPIQQPFDCLICPVFAVLDTPSRVFLSVLRFFGESLVQSEEGGAIRSEFLPSDSSLTAERGIYERGRRVIEEEWLGELPQGQAFLLPVAALGRPCKYLLLVSLARDAFAENLRADFAYEAFRGALLCIHRHNQKKDPRTANYKDYWHPIRTVVSTFFQGPSHEVAYQMGLAYRTFLAGQLRQLQNASSSSSCSSCSSCSSSSSFDSSSFLRDLNRLLRHPPNPSPDEKEKYLHQLILEGHIQERGLLAEEVDVLLACLLKHNPLNLRLAAIRALSFFATRPITMDLFDARTPQDFFTKILQQDALLKATIELLSEPTAMQENASSSHQLCRLHREVPREEVDWAFGRVPLGHGTFADVYKVKVNGKVMALKQFSIGYFHREESTIRREIATHCLLKHANLITCFGACLEDEAVLNCEAGPFILLELMNGTLEDLIYGGDDDKGGDSTTATSSTTKQSPKTFDTNGEEKIYGEPPSFTEAYVLSLALQIARGIRFLHSYGIVHRDLKPQNILMSMNLQTAKLADFGVSRPHDLNMTFQQGTLSYMAPETFSTGDYGTPVDIYSFGLILYEMVMRKRPMDGLKFKTKPTDVMFTMELKGKLEKGERPELPRRTPFASLIRHCWQTRPEKRPTAAQLVTMLENLSGSSSPTHSRSPSPPPPSLSSTSSSGANALLKRNSSGSGLFSSLFSSSS
ncbi:Serine/threonine-protein kinase Chk2 [Balamuthia mandrillaris]